MKNIYLVRHGQTDFNKKGIVQGMGVNSSINKLGKRQAESFYVQYRKVSFDKIYISELKRTGESVKKFINQGIPYESLYGLNEINWGHQEGKEVTPESTAYYQSVVDSWRQGNTEARIEGGESPEDVASRLKDSLDHILSQTNEKTILIAHHGRAIRVLMCLLMDYPLKYMDIFEHTNLCLYQLQYTGKQTIVKKFNDTSHLKLLDEL